MLVAVAVLAVVVLVGLAVRIGDLLAKQEAWDRIAIQRRRLAEKARALDEREVALSEWECELIRAAEPGTCPRCGLRWKRGEGSAEP